MSQIDPKFKGRKAVFLISCSPFQVMCVIEAINAFELKDYRVLISYAENELPREQRTFRILERYGIRYEVESFNYRITKADRLKMLMPVNNGYKLAFIGHCNDELLCYKAIRYVADGGTLIYLDDGTATIHTLNGLFHLTGKLKYYYNLVSKVRRLDFDHLFFTIYKNLSDGKHICFTNEFSFFASQMTTKGKPRDIVLLGVSTFDYCMAENIEPNLYFAELRKLVSDIKKKHPDEKIVFVPHGKDTAETPKQICQEFGMEFRPSQISVEMLLLEAPNRPVAVYGFRSSALYNIKLLFPEADVINVTFQGNKRLNEDLEKASDYYERCGIPRRVITLSGL